ncbi:MAG: flippase-like domain-containing protein, partial [Fibrobacteres bacterium]|nr:flippase-like domain-containing protein [Fibrobacterota bacterium]
MKKIAVLLLKIGVTAALFVILFRKLGFSAIFDRVLSADPLYLGIGCAVFFVSIVLSAVQWNLLLSHQGVVLGERKTFVLYMIGHFFNNFLPGAMGGD